MENIRQADHTHNQHWLVPGPANWVPLCLYIGVWANFLLSHRTGVPIRQALALGLALLALVILDRWSAWRYAKQPPFRVRLVVLLVQALLVEATVQIEGFELTAFLYLILPFTALLSFGSLAGIGVALLVWLVFALKVLVEDPPAVAIEGLALFAMAEGFVVVLSLLVLREQQARVRAEQFLGELHNAHADLTESHHQLAIYAEAAAELATVRERNRLARDIHDSLGHALTALAIQLEQAEAFRLLDPRMADHAVVTAKQLADDALDAVRRSVGVLRLAPPISGMGQALEALIAPLRAGLPELDLVVECNTAIVPLRVQAALLRIVQEGLTNVRRHAEAHHVLVRLSCNAQAVMLTIADDGQGFDLAAEHHQDAGYGLHGIAERVALLGGSLELTSAPDMGTTLHITMPTLGWLKPDQQNYYAEDWQ